MAYTHLTLEERYQIWADRKAGRSWQEIGEALGRSKATISREWRRNQGRRGYRPAQAHRRARERARHSRTRIRIGAWQWRLVERLLRQDWSPEQIAERGQQEATLSISPEWIYLYVYGDKALGGSLWRHLRCRAKYRKRYGSGRERRGRMPHRVGIEARPRAAAERTELGHWEGDTLVGYRRRGAVLTAVERRSRYTRLAKLGRRTAQATRRAFQRRLGTLSDRVRTCTLDNGREFADHPGIAKDLNARMYFADPYASWQRGTVENTNGLIRQYLPKTCDLRDLSGRKIQMIEQRLNLRPRKCLDYLTPYEVFYNTRLQLTVAPRS